MNCKTPNNKNWHSLRSPGRGKEISLKHAKEFSKWVILISIVTLIGHLCFGAQKLFIFTVDDFGMLSGLALFCLVAYLRDIVNLRPESKR